MTCPTNNFGNLSLAELREKHAYFSQRRRALEDEHQSRATKKQQLEREKRGQIGKYSYRILSDDTLGWSDKRRLKQEKKNVVAQFDSAIEREDAELWRLENEMSLMMGHLLELRWRIDRFW